MQDNLFSLWAVSQSLPESADMISVDDHADEDGNDDDGDDDGDDNDDEDGGEDDDGGDDGGYDGGGSDDDVHLEGEAGVDLLELAFARIRDVEFDLLPS